jgi:eukaryotic-like serine/threonine-protein kinase
MKTQKYRYYEFGEFRLDTYERLLLKNGQPVPLTFKVFDVLLVLVENSGRILEKEELMQRVWPDAMVEEANLKNSISAIRKALGEAPQASRYIQTLPKRGYRLMADVIALPDEDEAYLVEKHTTTEIVIDTGRDDENPIDNAVSSQQIQEDTDSNLPQAVAEIAAQPGQVPTAAPATPATEPAVRKVLRYKWGIAAALAVLAIAVVAAFFIPHRKTALTERDTILLADFVNTTGDPVFDGTLKQGLAVQLEQSPFLNLFSDEQVRGALRYMERPPDERVTKEVGREICQRQGLKAMLSGTISNLGNNYVIALEAINAQTGDVFAREQVEADGREQVLSSLGKAATRLREKLGESLASIQRYDAPLEQTTTSSLDAFKAYALAREQNGLGKFLDAIASLKRAIEIDPNFATAYGSLSSAYNNTRQQTLASQAGEKSFELRERASERERLFITAMYYVNVTGESDKSIEALEQLKQIYPRSYVFRNNLGYQYYLIGQYAKSMEEYNEAVRLNPNLAISQTVRGYIFMRLNRFDEAKEVFEQTLARKMDFNLLRYGLYSVAFLHGDEAAMQQQTDWASARPNEYMHLNWQAETALLRGQWRKSKEFTASAIEFMQSHNLKEIAENSLTEQKIADVLINHCPQAKSDAVANPPGGRSRDALFNIVIASAFCGDLNQAQANADEYAKRFPKDLLVNAIRLPVIGAIIAMRRNNPAQAIQLLQSASAYNGAEGFWPEYVCGLAYMNKHAGKEATAEFQTILDHSGWGPYHTSILYPLAQLGLARAEALVGDSAKSRKAYQDFFAMWKDADPDIPLLIEAKQEYAKLQ